MGKKLSMLFLLVGAILFVFGTHMADEVTQGQARISQAKEDEAGGRPVLGPVRRRMRAQANEEAQQRLSGIETRLGSTQVQAEWLRGAAIVLLVIGVGSLICSLSHKRKN